MRTFSRVISIIIIGLCSRCNNEAKNDSLFTSYIQNFKARNIPLNLSRKEVFSLSKRGYDTATNVYRSDIYKTIDTMYSRFIPMNIIKKSSIQNLRYIYSLGQFINKFPSVIIARDIIENDDQRKLELYLIVYSKNGQILDYKEIAGYLIDGPEYFALISNKDIITLKYLFDADSVSNPDNYFHLNEEKGIYNISEKGLFQKKDESITKGYFKGDWQGYWLVKKDDH